jgi:ankyrin repeat protein
MKVAKSDKKLLDAVKNGDKKGVEAALTEGANVNATGDFNNTALNYAADGGHTDIVILLIEKGADVNNKGGSDMSP